MMDKYRRPPVAKSYKVEKVEGTSTPWRVKFVVDGEEVGGGQYRTPEEADESGLNFMFSGWGDES